MALNRYFIDSNILIRHLTQDNQTLSPKATSFIEEIAKEEAIGFVTSLVVHEVIYIYVYQNIYYLMNNQTSYESYSLFFCYFFYKTCSLGRKCLIVLRKMSN